MFRSTKQSRISKVYSCIIHSWGSDPRIPVRCTETSYKCSRSKCLLKSQTSLQKMEALLILFKEEITWRIHHLDQWKERQFRWTWTQTDAREKPGETVECKDHLSICKYSKDLWIKETRNNVLYFIKAYLKKFQIQVILSFKI